MGDKTATYLATIFGDSYKRELDADESIWRSLPLFAAVVGLAISVLPAIYRAVIAASGWPKGIAIGWLIFATVAFMFAAGWFVSIIWPRNYTYPSTDLELAAYASQLETFHTEQGGLTAAQRDEIVRDAVRDLMIDQLARASASYRTNNVLRTKARTRVLLAALLGFGFAFGAQFTILVGEAMQPKHRVEASDGNGKQGRGSTGTGQTSGRVQDQGRPEAAGAASAAEPPRRSSGR